MHRMLESKSGFSGTRGSSACMVNHKMVQAEKQAKNMTIWSINNKKNKHCFCTPLWESAGGGKKCGQCPHRRSCTAFAGSHFPPPALNYSPVAPTELLSIHQAPPHPRQAQQKSILKQHSPQFPHYFTCQMLTKQSRKAKCSSGAPQHTSCQPRPY